MLRSSRVLQNLKFQRYLQQAVSHNGGKLAQLKMLQAEIQAAQKTGADDDNNNLQSLLSEYAVLKLQLEPELHKSNDTIGLFDKPLLEVKASWHMNDEEYRRAYGFERTAIMARYFHVLRDVLPTKTASLFPSAFDVIGKQQQQQLDIADGDVKELKAGFKNFKVSFGGKGNNVLRGNVISASQTCTGKPSISFDIDNENALYTFMMVDADYPLDSQQVVQPLPLYICSNIKHGDVDGVEVMPFVPPHPQSGTSIHRYVCLLLEQTSGLVFTKEDIRQELQSCSWNAQQFLVKREDLVVRGLSFFRSSYEDQTVPQLYKDGRVLMPRSLVVNGDYDSLKSYDQDLVVVDQEPVFGRVLERSWENVMKARVYKYAFQ
ncbi:hypothetical protein MIR68_004230 [Amoeboaphelidium protococcarum]|nr:hypothetical protein MIR68_004230 [Amoeboaphelidium protococcarum]